ncbi:arginine N-succinyltransferase [Shewanella corallii]|uniref:Arginine N-succinyltransferase n=1 Tax=Shewanella corallii TaxID=560080 RepID=A0ABT0NAX9_9GAMM|nr:arginine N-succinyltransferase [Shewanella corallii]MCL2914992.1 arginine N-succinyltransferase [Shewanella corallii]
MKKLQLSGNYTKQQGFSGVQVMLIVLAVILITTATSFYIIKTYIFPSPFTPVELNQQEAKMLDNKLAALGWETETRTDSQSAVQRGNTKYAENDKTNSTQAELSTAPQRGSDLAPEPYSESPADRLVSFSEKEVNVMIARSPDFGQRVAVDFSQDLASAKILIPVPEDFPVMPGQIVRVSAGLDIRLDADRRPVVALVGVSVMGVPIPNAWLGNIKRVNLVNEFGSGGFWTTFADGVEHISVTEGQLNIKLRP